VGEGRGKNKVHSLKRKGMEIMSNATKKKNDDDLSAAVEASGAVQTLHDTSMDIEKLIDQVSRFSVEDDQRVVQNGAALKAFKLKGDALSKRLADMVQEIVDVENESAKQMVAGKAPDLKRLNAIAMRKNDAESELRILNSVIESAGSQLAEAKAQARRENELKQWEVVAVVVNAFDDALQRLLEKRAIVERVVTLPVAFTTAHQLRATFDLLRRIEKDVTECRGFAATTVEKLSKTIPCKGGAKDV
jgi:hypothetical protein